MCCDKLHIESISAEEYFGSIFRIKSPYLIEYKEVFRINSNIYFVMPYFQEGDLSKYEKLKQSFFLNKNDV
jgi:serine/threonine protein kinase